MLFLLLTLSSVAQEWEEESNVDDFVGVTTSQSKVAVEIGAGASFGDVVRRYDTRIGLTPELQTYGVYEYDSWISGGPALSAFGSVFYKFHPNIEIGSSFGVTVYQKELSTGWEMQYSPGGIIEDDYVNYDPTTSAVLYFNPKIILSFMVAPKMEVYGLLGLYGRVFDGYNPPSLKVVDYSPRPGGIHFGAMFGGGVRLFTVSQASIFLELPYMFLLNSSDYSRLEISSNTPEYTIESIPQQPTYSNQIIALNLGVRYQF